MTFLSKLDFLLQSISDWYDSTLASIHACELCGIQNGHVKRIATSGTYYSSGWAHYYHPLCVRRVMADPERYGHQLADMALFISQRLSERKAWEEEEEAKQQADLAFNENRNKLAKQYKNQL